jgi:hypothetical protein
MAFWAVSSIVMFFAVVLTKAVIKTMNPFLSIPIAFCEANGIEDPAGEEVLNKINGGGKR